MEWGQQGKASLIVGGQFGSEGKGGIAAYLAHQGRFDIATCNAGAQAGHTTRYRDGRKFVCFHLPTTGVVQRDQGCSSYINAGSIIDIESFLGEFGNCDMWDANVFIHPNAAVISIEDRHAEGSIFSSTSKISSTQKGVGSALANKIMRRAKTAKEYDQLKPFIKKIDLNAELLKGSSVVVEVPQGTGLSLNHSGFYPYTTSRDCWVGSGLNDAGIHPSFLGSVCMVVRTFPIRVGNLFNEAGEQIGTSGGFFAESEELDWERDFPDIEPERTTVTKRVRRIASWSWEQYEHALRLNRPNIVALTFCDYLKKHDDFWTMYNRMIAIEERLGLCPKHIFAFGPCVEDVTSSLDLASQWYSKRSW